MVQPAVLFYLLFLSFVNKNRQAAFAALYRPKSSLPRSPFGKMCLIAAMYLKALRRGIFIPHLSLCLAINDFL